ncbi:hypothetical protein T484DRAFT_2988023 [Baffinella frigidus]|nr:hypothetical protein T484DRAFT_2988023 [Cryptophyta sp. CCMP2293]
MVYGQWPMVYGLWFMVHGVWCMGSGGGSGGGSDLLQQRLIGGVEARRVRRVHHGIRHHLRGVRGRHVPVCV